MRLSWQVVEHLKAMLRVDSTTKQSPLAFLHKCVRTRSVWCDGLEGWPGLIHCRLSLNLSPTCACLNLSPTCACSLQTKTALEVKPLKFTYSRLNSLLRTLEVTHLDEFNPLQVRPSICPSVGLIDV